MEIASFNCRFDHAFPNNEIAESLVRFPLFGVSRKQAIQFFEDDILSYVFLLELVKARANANATEIEIVLAWTLAHKCDLR